MNVGEYKQPSLRRCVSVPATSRVAHCCAQIRHSAQAKLAIRANSVRAGIPYFLTYTSTQACPDGLRGAVNESTRL